MILLPVLYAITAFLILLFQVNSALQMIVQEFKPSPYISSSQVRELKEQNNNKRNVPYVNSSIRISQAQYNAWNHSVSGYFTFYNNAQEFIYPVDKRTFAVTDTGYAITDFSLTRVTKESRQNSVVFVVDVSGSVQGLPLYEAISGIERFVKDSKGSFEYSGIVFSGDVSSSGGFTEDQQRILRDLNYTIENSGSGDTALFDGVQSGISKVAGKTGRKTVIVLSDGGENSSLASLGSIINSAIGNDVSIISIGIPGTDIDGGEGVMLQMADATGGFYMETREAEDISGAYRRIFQKMDEEYKITYKLPRNSTEQDRDIVIRLASDADTWGMKTYTAKPLFSFMPKVEKPGKKVPKPTKFVTPSVTPVPTPVLDEDIFKDAVSPVSDPSCEGYVYIGTYGYRDNPDDVTQREFHTGVDLARNPGCKIIAVYNGVMTRKSDLNQWFGNMVTIEHNKIFTTRYAHGEKFIGANGSKVQKKDEILFMGTTGRSYGIHLHFEVWKNGSHIDPAIYFIF